MKNKKVISITISVIIILSILLSVSVFINADEKEEKKDFTKMGLGSKIEDQKEVKENEIIAEKNDKDGLPTYYSHQSDMPPVGNQGGQGSCTGWATSYYKGFQENKDMTMLEWGNLFYSPAFIYNQINGGEDEGSYQSDAYELICDDGHCLNYTMPYDPGDYTTQPNAAQLNEADDFTANSWSFYTSEGKNAAYAADIKNWLYTEDDCLTVSMPICSDFYSGDYNTMAGTYYGNHALCIVGYTDNGDKLKFINSWGDDYGYDGYGYITYDLWDDFVDEVNDYQCRSYVMTDNDSPSYKNEITYLGSRTLDRVGANGAGNQWKYVMKNESLSTNIKYYQESGYPIHESEDEMLVSSYDGCYIKTLEVDSPYSESDYTIVQENLPLGQSVFDYWVVEDSSNKTLWRSSVKREVKPH
jgi:C1A family cysteine protease